MQPSSAISALPEEKLVSTIKVKIYVGQGKTQLLKQALGNSRFVWNKLLEKNIELYRKERKFLFYFDMCREITKMEKEYPFLKQSPSQALQQVARKLDRSLKDGIKRKRGFPKFNKRSRYEGVLIFPQGFRIDGRRLYLPRVGWVKIKDKITKKQEWENIKESAEQVWIKEEVNGFFAYVVYKRQKETNESNGRMVGVDVGIKNTITMSNGDVLSLNKRKIMALAGRAEMLQGAVDRKRAINRERGIKHSNRMEELEIRKDRVLKEIKSIKSDFYYKAVNYMLNSHEHVAVEKLNLKELKEAKKDNKKVRRNVNRYLQQTALSEFFRILNWKAELYGRKIIKVNPKNTSRTCSRCGYVNHKLKLKDRVFWCRRCGLKMDRDLNAAVNILKRGLKLIASSVGHIEYMREMVAMQPIRRTSNALAWRVCQNTEFLDIIVCHLL